MLAVMLDDDRLLFSDDGAGIGFWIQRLGMMRLACGLGR